MWDVLRERLSVRKRMVQSFSSASDNKRPIGRALVPPDSASVTSQQYRTRAIVFAAPARSRLTSPSSGPLSVCDMGKSCLHPNPVCTHVSWYHLLTARSRLYSLDAWDEHCSTMRAFSPRLARWLANGAQARSRSIQSRSA